MASRDLPSEIWSMILDRYYSTCHEKYQYALINKQCYAIMNPKLWLEPNNDWCSSIYPRLLESLLSAELYNKTNNRSLSQNPGHHIRKLHLGDLAMTDSLASLLKHTPMVVDLSIDLIFCGENEMLKYTNDELLRVPQLCPGITKLELQSVYLTTDIMESISLHCKHLNELTLRCCESASPNLLLPLVNHPLTAIGLYECSWTTARETARHLRRITTLTSLDIVECEQSYDIMRQLLPTHGNDIGLPLLVHLGFDPEEDYTDERDSILAAFMESHPHLTSLNLGNCDTNDSLLERLAPHLPNLQAVSFAIGFSEDLTYRTVRHFVTSCPALKKISWKKNPDDYDKFHSNIERYRNGGTGSTDENFGDYYADDDEEAEIEYWRDFFDRYPEKFDEYLKLWTLGPM